MAVVPATPQADRPCVDQDRVRAAVLELLTAIGEDPDREGLRGTPDRVARFWSEFIDYNAGNVETSFQSVVVDQMVLLTGVRVWSLCEHHLVPFSCDLTAAYITTNRVIGLSKIARICYRHAHRLQIQERLVANIADDLERVTGSQHVGVIGTGRHLCMAMRGVRSSADAVTSAMRGVFLTKPEARAELLNLHHRNGTT